MHSKKNDCLRQPVCFLYIRRGTFPYSIEDDASTTSQTSTTRYTNNTCVKLTIVTHLSFSQGIAIANLSFTTEQQPPAKKSRLGPEIITEYATDEVYETYFELYTKNMMSCMVLERVKNEIKIKNCTCVMKGARR